MTPTEPSLTDLKTELQRQAADRPDPADIRAALARAGKVRDRRWGAGLLAAAVVAVVLIGVALVAPGVRYHHSVGPAAASSTTTAVPLNRPSTPPGVYVPSVWTLQCAGAVSTAQSPDRGLTVIDSVVAINTAAQNPNPDPSGFGDHSSGYFAKSGLQIKAGQAFSIEVSGDSLARAAIGWSNISVNPSDVMKVDACPKQPIFEIGSVATVSQPVPAGDQWLTYPGGIWVADPMCVSLTVITPASSTTIHIPVGAPCT